MKTLVIIDAQPFYVDFQRKNGDNEYINNIVDNIVKKVIEFKNNRWPIVCVEFDPDVNGETIYDISKELNNYYLSFWARKEQRDGSNDIYKLINNLGLPKDLFVCGLYSNQCVRDTVVGFLKMSSDIKITILNNCVYPRHNYETDERVQKVAENYSQSVSIA